jgi:hypothetical protein
MKTGQKRGLIKGEPIKGDHVKKGDPIKGVRKERQIGEKSEERQSQGSRATN